MLGSPDKYVCVHYSLFLIIDVMCDFFFKIRGVSLLKKMSKVEKTFSKKSTKS